MPTVLYHGAAPISATDAGNTPFIKFEETIFNTDNVYEFSCTASSLINVLEIGRKTATAETWVDWGVPADAEEVTDILVGLSYWRRATTGVNTINLRAYVTDNANTQVASNMPFNNTIPTTVDASWQVVSATGSVSIDLPYRSPTTVVKLNMANRLDTDPGAVDYRFAILYVDVTITYTYLGQDSTVTSLIFWDW